MLTKEQSATLSIDSLKFLDLGSEPYIVFIQNEQILCTTNGQASIPQITQFISNQASIQLRLYQKDTESAISSHTISLPETPSKEPENYHVQFYKEPEKNGKSSKSLKATKTESEESSSPEHGENKNEATIILAEIDFQIKLLTTSAQGTRQRARFVDGVSEEILMSLSRTERSRQEAIFELIQTEQNYVHDMNVIVNEFVIPLHKQEILSKEDIYNICINLDIILPINQSFLNDLLQRQSHSVIVDDVSDIILKHQTKFDVYIEYCSKHSFALRRVSEYTEKYEKFKEFMAVPKPSMKETLQGYLVKPFQRLTRYTMLVQSILKSTPVTDPARLNLTIAWYHFKRTATKANSQLRLEEERVKAVEAWDILQQSKCAHNVLQAIPLRFLQKTLTNSLLVSENNPMSLALFYARAVMTHNNSSTTIDGFVFLFNDCLLITKGKDTKSLVPIQRTPLQDILIISSPKPLLPIDQNDKMRLSLLHGKRMKSISHVEYDLLISEHTKNKDKVLCIQSFWRMLGPRREFTLRKTNSKELRALFETMKQQEEEFRRKITALQSIIDPLMNNDDLRALFNDLTDIALLRQYSAKLVTSLSLLAAQDDLYSSSTLKAYIPLWSSILEPLRKHVTAYAEISEDLNQLPQERPDLLDLIKNTEKSKELTPGGYVELLEQPSFHVRNYYQQAEQLVSLLPSSHSEHKKLCTVRNAFKKLDEYCESLREHARNAQRLSSIQSRLSQFDGLEEEGRTFIREGALTLIPEEGDKTIFMFSDILIISDAKTNRIRNVLQLDDLVVVDLNDTHFMLIDRTQKTYIFKAPRNIHKRRWVKELKEAVDAIQKEEEAGDNARKLYSSVRTKRSASVVDNPLKRIIIRAGADLWSFSFPDSAKHNDEFSEHLHNALELIYRETLHVSTKTLPEDPYLQQLEEAKKSLPPEQLHSLLPLLKQIHNILQTDRSYNEAAKAYTTFKNLQNIKVKLRFDFHTENLLRQPKSVLLAPPKPPVATQNLKSSTPKGSSRRWTPVRDRATTVAAPSTNNSRIGSLERIFREFSDPVESLSSSLAGKGTERVVEMHHRLQSMENDMKTYETQLVESSKRIELLESQNLILSESVGQYSEKIQQLENSNRLWETRFSEQEQALDNLRSTWENYMKEREARVKESKKRKRARRKAAKETSKSDAGDATDDISQDVSETSLRLKTGLSFTESVDMPVISEELLNSGKLENESSVSSQKKSKSQKKKRKTSKELKSDTKKKTTPKQRSHKNIRISRVKSDLGKSSSDNVADASPPKPDNPLTQSANKKPKQPSCAKSSVGDI